MDWDFVDLATKAKELGISDGTLRARALSADLPCYIHLANEFAVAEDREWLPAWTHERFPICHWRDIGAHWEQPDPFNFQRRDDPTEIRHRQRYYIRGWVELDSNDAAVVLTRGKTDLDRSFIYVVDVSGDAICCLSLRVQPEKEWANDNGEGGGYWRDVPITLTPSDLFMPAADHNVSAEKSLDPRERASLLSIIRALAKEANYDLSQPYKAGDALAAALKRDFDINLSGRGIGEHLKRAVSEVGTQSDSRPSK